MNNKIRLLFLTVLLLGFSLRIKGLFTGLPSETGRLSTHHFDEYITFGALGSMNPSKLDFYPSEALYWGTFQVYAQGALLKTMQLAGIFKPGGKEELLKNPLMADRMYVSGRLFVVFFSCLSLILIFLISAKLLSGFYILIPPLFLSLAYAEIFMSSLVKPDSIMLFFGLCSFYFSINILKGEKGLKGHVLAGLFTGLSFVTKYTGIIFVFNYAVAVIYAAWKGEKLVSVFKKGILFFFVVFLVFILINPYFLIRNAQVMAYMKAVFSKGALSGNMLSGYLEYFSQIMPASLGWPAWILSLVALFYGLVLSEKKEIRLASAFSCFYLLKFGYSHGQIFTYSLPVIPFLALSLGYFMEKKLPVNFFYKAAAFLVLVYTFFYSAYQKKLWSDSNTINASNIWLESNLNEKSRICLSRIDVWTPSVLRKYGTRWNLSAAASPSESFLKSLENLGGDLKGCDYLVLSEYEMRLIEKEDALNGLKKDLSNKFSVSAEFKRPRNPLFIPSDSRQYLNASFMNPDMYILKKEK